MPIISIEPRRLYRQIADQLRQLIDDGEFAEGQRLPTERELALKLGVSRPTVREALIALEVDGRIRIRVGSGIYVQRRPRAQPTNQISAAPPVAGPFDILKARALFEGAVADEAAQTATPADIVRIDRVIDAMHATQHPGQASLAVDRAFHVAVAECLRNDAITKIVGDLFDQRINPYFAQLASYFENAASWQAALAEHAAIRDRIAAHDGPGARDAMRLHFDQSQLRFSDSFGDAEPTPMSVVEIPRRASAAKIAARAGVSTKSKRQQHKGRK
ncbi:MAG: FadR/GntR family transcriptional regulator [Hyphomicrobiaceae bacterium]|nr:FadR family transcriptional regulator [Hyphomicrobiaceae bacterium]